MFGKGRFLLYTNVLRDLKKNLSTRIRFEKCKFSGKTPVFVYQMGKVGSTSLRRSLIRQYQGFTVHAHLFAADHSKYEVQLLNKYYHTNKKVKIISIVREPIQRNISAFFQDIEIYTRQQYNPSTETLDSLKKKFLLTYPHYSSLDWFDDNMKKDLGLDIYKWKFPESNYLIINQDNIDLLLYKHELDQKAKEDLIATFLGLKKFSLSRENVSVDEVSGKDYLNFKENVTLPPFLIDKMRESQYYNHFYSEAEIEKSLSKYSE